LGGGWGEGRGRRCRSGGKMRMTRVWEESRVYRWLFSPMVVYQFTLDAKPSHRRYFWLNWSFILKFLVGAVQIAWIGFFGVRV
jgi:hypothetical protein